MQKISFRRNSQRRIPFGKPEITFSFRRNSQRRIPFGKPEISSFFDPTLYKFSFRRNSRRRIPCGKSENRYSDEVNFSVRYTEKQTAVEKQKLKSNGKKSVGFQPLLMKNSGLHNRLLFSFPFLFFGLR